LGQREDKSQAIQALVGPLCDFGFLFSEQWEALKVRQGGFGDVMNLCFKISSLPVIWRA
jgi:hypothetical protein